MDCACSYVRKYPNKKSFKAPGHPVTQEGWYAIKQQTNKHIQGIANLFSVRKFCF